MYMADRWQDDGDDGVEAMAERQWKQVDLGAWHSKHSAVSLAVTLLWQQQLHHQQTAGTRRT
jgi:hypothetical protein